MTHSCIIIDDEPLAREVLENYVRKVPTLKLLAVCRNAIEGIPLTKKEKPDIVFCDIKMPELNGLEFIRTLETKPAVIITSAYTEFAIEGFDLGVTDYLLKPIRFERFLKAVTRALGNIPGSANEEDEKEKIENPFIFFKTDGEFVKVFLRDLQYVEAFGNYVKIHTNTKPLLVKDKISAIEELLDKKVFVRIHKSYIIPIHGITKYYGNTICLGKTQLPVGSFYKKDFLKAFGSSE